MSFPFLLSPASVCPFTVPPLHLAPPLSWFVVRCHFWVHPWAACSRVSFPYYPRRFPLRGSWFGTTIGNLWPPAAVCPFPVTLGAFPSWFVVRCLLWGVAKPLLSRLGWLASRSALILVRSPNPSPHHSSCVFQPTRSLSASVAHFLTSCELVIS